MQAHAQKVYQKAEFALGLGDANMMRKTVMENPNTALNTDVLVGVYEIALEKEKDEMLEVLLEYSDPKSMLVSATKMGLGLTTEDLIKRFPGIFGILEEGAIRNGRKNIDYLWTRRVVTGAYGQNVKISLLRNLGELSNQPLRGATEVASAWVIMAMLGSLEGAKRVLKNNTTIPVNQLRYDIYRNGPAQAMFFLMTHGMWFGDDVELNYDPTNQIRASDEAVQMLAMDLAAYFDPDGADVTVRRFVKKLAAQVEVEARRREMSGAIHLIEQFKHASQVRADAMDIEAAFGLSRKDKKNAGAGAEDKFDPEAEMALMVEEVINMPRKNMPKDWSNYIIMMETIGLSMAIDGVKGMQLLDSRRGRIGKSKVTQQRLRYRSQVKMETGQALQALGQMLPRKLRDMEPGAKDREGAREIRDFVSAYTRTKPEIAPYLSATLVYDIPSPAGLEVMKSLLPRTARVHFSEGSLDHVTLRDAMAHELEHWAAGARLLARHPEMPAGVTLQKEAKHAKRIASALTEQWPEDASDHDAVLFFVKNASKYLPNFPLGDALDAHPDDLVQVAALEHEHPELPNLTSESRPQALILPIGDGEAASAGLKGLKGFLIDKPVGLVKGVFTRGKSKGEKGESGEKKKKGGFMSKLNIWKNAKKKANKDDGTPTFEMGEFDLDAALAAASATPPAGKTGKTRVGNSIESQVRGPAEFDF